MRPAPSLVPPSETDPGQTELWKRLSTYLRGIDSGFKLIDSGLSPTGGNRPISILPGTMDHGTLTGLVPIVNTNGTIQDQNDDHTQYLDIHGRVGGQTAFGSRLDETLNWVDKGMLAEDANGVDGTSWASIPLANGALATEILVIALASRPVSNVASSGATSIHSTIVDDGSNTWTKLQEFSHNAAGADITVSLWYTVVTTALVAGTDTLTVTFATSADTYALEARRFAGFAGAVVEIATSNTATTSAGAGEWQLPAMTITAQTGSLLYTRVVATSNTATGADEYNETSSFNSYIFPDTIHDDATVLSNIGARGEFKASSEAAATSSPTLAANQFPLSANIFASLRIVSGTGNLTLKSIDFPNAAVVELDDATTHIRGAGNATDRLVIFEDEDEVELSWIAASDGAFHGAIVMTADLDMAGFDIINCGDIFFNADDTHDIGTTTISPKVIYGRGFSFGDGATLGVPSSFQPAIINWSGAFATKTLDGIRILVENTDSGATSHSRNLFLQQVIHNGVSGTIIEMDRTTVNVASAILPAAITLADSFGSGEVAAAIGASFTLNSAGGTTTLIALVVSATGATITNFALQATDGDIAIDSDTGRLLLGEGQNASLVYNGNLVIDPQVVGSGIVSISGDLGIQATAMSGLAERLRITTAVGGYGWRHDDGTTAVASLVDAAAGYLGTVSNHVLEFITNDALGGVRIEVSPKALHIHTGASIDLDDNLEVRFGTGNDAKIDYDGTNLNIVIDSGLLLVQDQAQFSTPSLTTSGTNVSWVQVQEAANSATESNFRVFAINAEALFQEGVNRGRNFTKHTGVKAETRYQRTSGITWTGSPVFIGGEFVGSYVGPGVLAGGVDLKIHGGEFKAEARGNPSGAMTIGELWGGLFTTFATTAMAALTITNAIAGKFTSDVQGANAVTRNYGILITDIAGGSTIWGLNLNGADMQISSNNWLLLEGSDVSKGDTGLRYNSANADIEVDINGTNVLKIDVSSLEIIGGKELRFYDVGDSNYVGFAAPALTGNQIWVLPPADGLDGDVLTTDGSGNLAWLSGASEKAWSFGSRTGASGTLFAGGYYLHSGTANDFSGGPTFGTANGSYAAHFFVVLGATTVDELTLTVTGTSITDTGTRTASDTENIVIPNADAVDSYYETTKKWIGQVTITVASGTAKTCDFGYAKYWDNNNTDFKVAGCECTWLGGATDTGADIILRHHKGQAGNTDWTYTGSGATPPTAIAAMATDHSTESSVLNGENGSWKRNNLATNIMGSTSEGTIFEVVTAANKAFEYGNLLLRITPQ